MSGTKGKSGGPRAGAGAKPTPAGRLRHELTPEAATALRLMAWEDARRPTTAAEEDDYLSRLVLDVAAARTPPLSTQTPEEIAAFWARVQAANDTEEGE